MGSFRGGCPAQVSPFLAAGATFVNGCTMPVCRRCERSSAQTLDKNLCGRIAPTRSAMSGLAISPSISTKHFYRSKNFMLSQAQRTTILELNTQGVSKREIARVLGISRVAVRKVLRSNSTALPELRRTKAEPYRQQILDLFEK